MGATLAIGALTLAAPIPTQHAVTDHVLGAGILRGRSRHTRSYSKDSCETGGYVSRSPPAIHKNSLFLKMSVARHIGPDIFLLLTVVGFLGWVGLGFVQEGNCKAFLIQCFLTSIVCSASLFYSMPVAASKVAKEVDADMLLSFPFPHTSFC